MNLNVFDHIADFLDKRIKKKIGERGNGTSFSAKQYVDWHDEAEKECPKLYRIWKFFDDIDTFCVQSWRWYIEEPYWRLKRGFSKHDYHSIRLRDLEWGAYAETDTQMVLAMKELVKQFIEVQHKGKPWTVEEWEKWKNGEKSRIGGELGDDGIPNHQWESDLASWQAYIWWTETKPALEKQLEKMWKDVPDIPKIKKTGVFYNFMADMVDEDGSKERRKYYDKINKLEQEIDDGDTAHMINVIKHRKSMWT